MRIFALALLAITLHAAPRVLYVTHSAGYRHDSIPASVEVLRGICTRTGLCEVEATEDLSAISADNLRRYSAVLFFTSGELSLSASQREALLAFVDNGGGFGGFHSATDTLYSWPAYGALIGGYFDGHPWTQEARIDVEDPEHPATRGLASPWTITEEFYQFRAFSRDRVRVLMTLDTTSVDLNTAGAHRETEDFPLMWVRRQGAGRVFYSAPGHFEGTWRNRDYQRVLEGALAWLTGAAPGEAEPRVVRPAAIAAAGNAASMQPANVMSPGGLISIYGTNLSTGAAMQSNPPSYARRLAGTVVRVNGQRVPILYASPSQINALVPAGAENGFVRLSVQPAGGAETIANLRMEAATPGIFTATASARYIIVWATGLGDVREQNGFVLLAAPLTSTVGGLPAEVLFAGYSPQWPGLYQVNLLRPPEARAGVRDLHITTASGTAARVTVDLPPAP